MPIDSAVTPSPRGDDLAIVLDGGGARAAYQVGLLRGLVRRYPDLRLPLITGVSAGAINATFLASHPGPPTDAVDELTTLWCDLTIDQVFRVDTRSLAGNVFHWGLRLISGGRVAHPPARGLVDTAPLRKTLEEALQPLPGGEIPGIARNLASGRLSALAILTSSYTTGRSVAWVEGPDIQQWDRPFRHHRQTRLTVEHVMASAALPLLFPAVRLEGAWYGDGGIRLVTPLSPAVHMGANRILAFSTRYARTREQAEVVQVRRYPPPMQIAGQLLNAVFLDDHERDAMMLERINALIHPLPEEQRHGLREIDLVFLRPSRDIGRLAAEYEPKLPGMFRHLVGGLGSRDTTSPDLLSLLMFVPEYLRALIEIGEADVEARADEIATLVERP
ncbi:MAG: patatin-like phospholipase family protein [Vicinamibacterales bacterium]